MLEGEITVVGKDTVSINLGSQRHPDKIVCNFEPKRHHHHVPCNPHQEDLLQWSCSQLKDGFFYLIISWNTTRERDIKWSVFW